MVARSSKVGGCPVPSGDPVVLLGPQAVGLVRAVHAVATAPVGPYAIIGGVGVTIRLGEAHRATADVDTVVSDDRTPSAVEVLRSLPGAVADPEADHRLYVNGTKVEVLAVGSVTTDDDLEGVPEKNALFVASHAWALDSATEVSVMASDDPLHRTTARVATPGALVAMKLHAIEDRSPTSGVDKRAGDAWDIFRLLVDLDGDGTIREELGGVLPSLRQLVAAAAERVLVKQAARTSSWMRSGDGVIGDVSAEELRTVGRPLCEALR